VLVPKAIVRFRELAPKASVKLIEGTAADLLKLLDTGQLDIVVARLPNVDNLRLESSAMLLNDPLVVCCGVRHPLVSKPELGWADLAEFGWITPAIGSPAYEAFARLLFENKIPLDMAVESISIMANLTMYEASDLIGVLPLSLAKRLALEHRIAILPVSTKNLLAQVSAHWDPIAKNPLTAVMATCLIEVAQGL
jgi:DNA-binding transcriptional LysR family regulator